MEGNGTEVTQKIRSLITNKLVELGVYVDEELPDYIMVMVANKKSKIHMSDDLMLFLGNHTSVFTNWLNGILESLPSSVSDKKSVSQKVSSSPSDVCPESPQDSTGRVQDGGQVPTEEMEEMFSFKEEETDDFLSEEMNQESVPPPDEKSARSEPMESARAEDPKKIVSTKSNIHFPTSVVKTVEGSASSERRRTVAGIRVAAKVRPMVQNRLAYDEEEDEYDPRNPAVGSVASVVRVTERKWSVPPALQANKLLLLKAMEDANKSVKRTSVRRPGTPVEPYRPTPIQHLARETIEDEPDLRLFLRGRSEGSAQMVVAPSPPPPPPPLPPRGIKRKAEQQKSEISPKFVVTLDGIDPAKLVRDVISTNDRIVRDDEDDSGEEDEALGEEKLMERCRYWPACRNGDSCTRHHPSIPCKSFPSCRFGDKCLYIHPNCRFDSRCSRKDCPYTHASKRLLPPRQIRVPSIAFEASHSLKKKTLCKYYPSCNTSGCIYLHPKMCRFGGRCRAASCPFGHPLPSPEKMKWVAPSTS